MYLPAGRVEALDYKKKIFICLDQLIELFKNVNGAKEEYEALRREVKKVKDQRQLFGMLQSLREVIASETKSDASFKMRMPDGSTKEFNNLDEAQAAISGYKNTEVNNKPVQTTTSGRKFRGE